MTTAGMMVTVTTGLELRLMWAGHTHAATAM
jgi:hypothetical protein